MGTPVTAGRILVISSCTGLKAGSSDGLTPADFSAGVANVRARHRSDLADAVMPAESLYRGQHHLRLMRGIRAARDAGLQVDLRIVSAGYGLVRGNDPIAPYECTFQGMGVRERHEWSQHVEIPSSVKSVLAEPYALGLILLGEDYLAACQLDESLTLGGPTLVFCAPSLALKLPTSVDHLTAVPVGRREAQRFSCGLVSLKGDIGARVLAQAALEVWPEPEASARQILNGLDDAGRVTDDHARANLALF